MESVVLPVESSSRHLKRKSFAKIDRSGNSRWSRAQCTAPRTASPRSSRRGMAHPLLLNLFAVGDLVHRGSRSSTRSTTYFTSSGDERVAIRARQSHPSARRIGAAGKSELIGRTAAEASFSPLLGDEYARQDTAIIATGEPLPNELELHLYPTGAAGWCLTTKLPALKDAPERCVGPGCRAICTPTEDYADVAATRAATPSRGSTRASPSMSWHARGCRPISSISGSRTCSTSRRRSSFSSFGWTRRRTGARTPTSRSCRSPSNVGWPPSKSLFTRQFHPGDRHDAGRVPQTTSW